MTDGTLSGFFIADNLLEGPLPWPSEAKGAPVEEDRGIEISGAGQEVCYNRVRNFKDGIDTFPSQVCAAIDIHHNDVSECLDDGCEMDYSERNTRLFCNRFTDVFQGISVQPVFGGPVYVFRNVVYNIDVEAVKMHNSPSGALFFHNTFVKQGVPLVLLTSEPVRNSVYRNNLFIGTGGNYAYECNPPMIDCDFDYDGFGGGPWKLFLKWNNVRYATAQEARGRPRFTGTSRSWMRQPCSPAESSRPRPGPGSSTARPSISGSSPAPRRSMRAKCFLVSTTVTKAKRRTSELMNWASRCRIMAPATDEARLNGSSATREGSYRRWPGVVPARHRSLKASRCRAERLCPSQSKGGAFRIPGT